MPNTKLKNRITDQWIEIGFQGKDPSTDFRGAGMLGLEQLLALEGIVLDVVFYDLVSGHVDHVVFDCEVGTGGINWKVLFVVDEDYLW